jgi:Fe-S cluster biosynthesis and repair protein YggX
MSQLQERIAQFRKMATDDPDNELGHFRLGQLLSEAGQDEEAVQSIRRAIEISPRVGKFYQHLAGVLLRLDRHDQAVQTLRQGFSIADEDGQNLPRDEMAKMLRELGEAVPESKQAAASQPAAAGGGFACKRPDCRAGAYAHQLAAPPMKDELGQRIYRDICGDCWNEWLRNYSIKVINELRIDLSTERGQETYDEIMRQFFGFE